MENQSKNNLQHHGILGQKWGVRRFQNKDGSLTKAGKERIKEDSNQSEKQQRKEASKNRRTLSDADLKKRIERMELERRMKDLTDKDVSPGKAFISDVLSNSGKRVATTVFTGAALYVIKAGLEGKINWKEAAQYLAPKPKNK